MPPLPPWPWESDSGGPQESPNGQSIISDNSVPWAFPDDTHEVYTWYGPGGPGFQENSTTGGKKKKSGGRRRRGRKPKPVRVHPGTQARRQGGRATQAYPTASTATGGAMPVREMDALSEVGLMPILAELVNHGNVTLGQTLMAWQREQDRITNRTWRRPGGLMRPAGL